jgi:hypothetical protein
MKRLVLCLFLSLSLPACALFAHRLTPAELQAHGTRRYPNVARDKVVDACATALANLGYDVTQKTPEMGQVRTKPKTVGVSARTSSVGSTYHSSRRYSTTYDNSVTTQTTAALAWNVLAEASGPDVVVHLTPRAYQNGAEVHEEGIWIGSATDALFNDLFAEIDATLGVQTAPSTPAR